MTLSRRTAAKSYNWYRRDPKKFIRGVRGLGPDVIGAYAVILDLIYEDEESCPNDAKWLAGILGCSWQKVVGLVRTLVKLKKLELGPDNRLRNPRATSELVERRSAAGQPETPPVEAEMNHTLRSTSAGPAELPLNENKELSLLDKNREDKNRTEKKESASLRSATSPATRGSNSKPKAENLEIAVKAYNAVAGPSGWPEAKGLANGRASAVAARLREVGADGWTEAMTRAANSDFLTGKTPRDDAHANWTPDLTWFAKAENFTRLIEGRYDNRDRPAQPRRDPFQKKIFTAEECEATRLEHERKKNNVPH